MGWLSRGPGPVMAQQPSGRYIRTFPFQVLWALLFQAGSLGQGDTEGRVSKINVPPVKRGLLSSLWR